MSTQKANPRQALRAELEANQKKFQELLNSVPDSAWRSRSDNRPWSNADVLGHITMSLDLTNRLLANARRGKGAYNYPSFLMPRFLINSMNTRMTRNYARKQTKRTMSQKYDAAHHALLATLDNVKDDEWSKSVKVFNAPITVEALFHMPAMQVQEHAPQIKR